MFIQTAVVFACTYVMCVSACCMPGQFEIIEGLTEGYMKDGAGGKIEAQSMVSVDSTLKMTNENWYVYTNGKATHIRMIKDYGNTSSQFMIDEASQTCTKSPLPGKWPGTCIPAGSTKISSSYIGLPSSRFGTDLYMVNTTPYPGISAYVMVSQDGCIPVGESISGRSQGADFLMNIGFTNFTEGIKDPSVFEIPSVCSHSLHMKPHHEKMLPSVGSFFLP